MKKKYVGMCAAALVGAGVIGGTVFGIENKAEATENKKVTLQTKNDGFTFGDITAQSDSDQTDTAMAQATAKEIEQIPAQSDGEEQENYLPNIKKITKDVMPSIVAITNESVENIDFFGRTYQQNAESCGSGIIVGKNDKELLIATNNHVVEGAEDLTVCFSVDTEDEEEKLVPAQVKGTESSLDLAVIAVKLDDISDEVADKIGIVQLGDSDEVEVGDWTIAIGNALGYGQSVTFGIISALDREVTVSTDNGIVSNHMLQTDAAINFGNSGGALLDADGRLIGINSAKAAKSGVEGMGYAIPINTAKSIIEDLMNQTTREKVDEKKAGALGVIPYDVTEEAKQIYNIPSGAFVYELTKDSPAEEAGIRKGDIIIKLDKTGISSKKELLDRMQYYKAGETVTVTVKRAGSEGYEEKEIDVKLMKKSDLPDYEEQQDLEYSEEDDGYGDEDQMYDENYGHSYGIEDFFNNFMF